MGAAISAGKQDAAGVLALLARGERYPPANSKRQGLQTRRLTISSHRAYACTHAGLSIGRLAPVAVVGSQARNPVSVRRAANRGSDVVARARSWKTRHPSARDTTRDLRRSVKTETPRLLPSCTIPDAPMARGHPPLLLASEPHCTAAVLAALPTRSLIPRLWTKLAPVWRCRHGAFRL
jgi:hypothetical protein